MRFKVGWLLVVPCALAANLPTFTYTAPPGTKVEAIAVDAAGNTYLTGSTSSSTFPTTPGALQTEFISGTCDTLFTPGGAFTYPCTGAFVVKLDPSGNTLFATYLGGDGSQTVGSAICVDADGNIYVGGATSQNTTHAPDTFPVTPGAAFTNPATSGAFVAKLNATGTQLVYATLLPLFPQNFFFDPLAMAIDSSGNAYIASTTQEPANHPFPTTPGAFQGSAHDTVPGIVAKLNASGSALVYATYLSGTSNVGPTSDDIPQGIAVDSAGNAFITGYTGSQVFPVTAGAYQTKFPGTEWAGFVTKLNPQGTGLVYSTFVGTSGESGPWAIKVDSQGGAYVLGQKADMASSGDVLMHLASDGSSLSYSTFLPAASALDIDAAGNAFVAGVVGSAGVTATAGAFQPAFAGGSSDAFAMKFTPDGQIAGATYLGGSDQDVASLIAVAPNGSVVISGNTRSSDLPGVAGPAPNSAPSYFVTSLFASLTVINSASYVPTAIAPGEIVSLLGYGIGPTTGVGTGGPSLPTQLGGVQVFFGGIAAPLLYAQSHVINAQVPWELAGQTSATVQVSYPGLTFAPTPVTLATSVPGIFSINNSDGMLNSPSNPAKPGDFITIYGTGGGLTNPVGITGGSWPLTTTEPLITLRTTVTIGGENASVLYSGASPLNFSGVFQINVRVPADLPPATAASLNLTIGNASSPTVSMAIGTR